MAEWTQEQVAARFEDAADTAERLPSLRSLGYVNIWPSIVRTAVDRKERDDLEDHTPPSPEAIDRMVETNRWALWLEEEQRHLIWMRAQRCKWRDIGIRFACCTRTAQRRWNAALLVVATQLNAQNLPEKMGNFEQF
jgi:hypothetical protein